MLFTQLPILRITCTRSPARMWICLSSLVALDSTLVAPKAYEAHGGAARSIWRRSSSVNATIMRSPALLVRMLNSESERRFSRAVGLIAVSKKNFEC